MPSLRLPGERMGLGYVWLMFLSPLLLFVFGAALLGLGLWRHVNSVAAIGGVALVGCLILPRMQGSFEIGPGGIKGDLENDIFREVLRKAIETGHDADEALELAVGATGPTGPTGPSGPSRRETANSIRAAAIESSTPIAPLSAYWSNFATTYAEQTVQESVLAEQTVHAIIDRVASEKKWRVARGARVNLVGTSAYRVFDFVLATRKGNIFVDVAKFATPQQLGLRMQMMMATLERPAREEIAVRAALIVVPNGALGDAVVPALDFVEAVEVGQLEQKLRELAPGD
jgi:hypothetical protein